MIVTLLMAIVAGGAILSLVGGKQRLDNAATDQEIRIDSSNLMEWTTVLSKPTEVVFEQRVPVHHGEDGELRLSINRWNVQTFGPLGPDEKARLRARFMNVIEGNRLKLFQFQQQCDFSNPEHVLQEASILQDIETRIAELECLEKDNYWTVRDGDKFPIEHEGMVVFFHNLATVDEQAVDVVFPIVFEQYPNLVAVRERVRMANEYRLRTIVGTFNNQSLEARQAAYTRHQEAVEKLKAGPLAKLDQEGKNAWRLALNNDLLPHGTIVRPPHYRMSLRN